MLVAVCSGQALRLVHFATKSQSSDPDCADAGDDDCGEDTEGGSSDFEMSSSSPFAMYLPCFVTGF